MLGNVVLCGFVYEALVIFMTKPIKNNHCCSAASDVYLY